ncbi:MAG: hypothetical protein AAFU49_24785, partial [Pseudomonadota bacterium]
LNAIRHASGARLTKAPALPHRVLAAIRAAETAESSAAGRRSAAETALVSGSVSASETGTSK